MSNQITIKDLCPEEKKKIGELLKRLSSETEEKEKLKQMIEEDKKLYESKINSLKEMSMNQSTNHIDFKSESFAQSFIGNSSLKNNKPNPSANDIQTLRVKFDELFETVKKAAKTNETLISRIQKGDSFVEDKPMFDLPKPIEQNVIVLNTEEDLNNSNSNNNNNNNILQTSFMDDIKKYNENDKSFMSSNEDMFNGLLSSAKKNNTFNYTNNSLKKTNYYTNSNANSEDNVINNQGTHMGRTCNMNSNKYKEMLGRIREKSQEQHSNVNVNAVVNTKSPANKYQTSKIQYQFNQMNNMNNNKNDVSISHSIQLNIPSESKNKNIKDSFDNNNIHTYASSSNKNNNKSICDNTEYKHVLNLLNNNNKDTIAKLNASTILNENLQTSTSIQSSTSKIEEIANDNVFNYIFELEKKSKQNNKNNTKQDYSVFNPHFNSNNNNDNQNEIDEVEREINCLNERTMAIESKSKESTNSRTNNNNKAKGYRTQYAKGCNKLYEDFTKINSKYI